MEEDKRTVSRLFLFVLTLEIDSILSRKIYNYRNYTKISLPCISKINSKKKYESTYYFFRKINK